jgi:hypothetical protein
MMKNTLTDLNNYLFETLEKLIDDEATEEQMQREITRSHAVTSVAETIIKNSELALKTMKHLNEYGIETPRKSLPPMLAIKNE